MHRSFRIVSRLLVCLGISLLFLFTVLFVAVVCFEQRIPQGILDRALAHLSSDNYLIHVDSASFRLTRVVRLVGVRIRDRRKLETAPFLSAARVDVELALERLPWRFSSLIREVVVTGLYFPRLPDGYYIPDSIEFPGQPDFKEVSAPLDVTFPEIPSFKLTLIRPDVLSVRPERVDVAAVTIKPKIAKLSGIFLQWPDRDVNMSLDGETSMDLFAQSVRGNVHGQARLPNIRPMLGALEITNSYSFMDAFTGVRTPVDATCQFDVNLVNNDLHIFLDLHPTGGKYRGVPFKDAHGLVDIRVYVRDTYQNAKIVVGPLAANFPDGKMEGTVIYENTNDVGYVNFNVESTVALSNALAVANILTDGTLDCLQPETSPYITLKGVTAVDPAYSATNDLHGYIQFERGRLFSIPLQKARSQFHVKGTRVDFFDAMAMAPRGGELTGTGWVSYPGFEMAKSTFGVSINGKGLTLADLGDAFHLDVGDRQGLLEGNIHLEGPLGAEASRFLSGSGRVAVKKGDLATLNILAGLFDAMENLPGMGRFVAQSRQATGIVISNSSMSYKLANGVLTSDDVTFRGGLFTIVAKGSYDYLRDELDFAVRVKIVKDDSFLGMLKNPILWPFSKLSSMFLGFRVSGSLEKPSWKYDMAILDRF